jgi:hypothetical protein
MPYLRNQELKQISLSVYEHAYREQAHSIDFVELLSTEISLHLWVFYKHPHDFYQIGDTMAYKLNEKNVNGSYDN